eukprot:Gb_24186 [translate_table: standard]
MRIHPGSMAEPDKIEQIVVEFFAKTLQIIVESRIPPVSSSSPLSPCSPAALRAKDKWFSLALGDNKSFNVEPWGKIPTLEPMFVDVLLLGHMPPASRASVPITRAGGPLGFLDVRDEESKQTQSVDASTILERWTVHYAQNSSSINNDHSNADVEVPVVYKKAVILLRSLYCTARLLPAYRHFRHLKSTCNNPNTPRLVHRILASPEPRPRREMASYSFAPVETPLGKLCVSVSYLPTTKGSISAVSEAESSSIPLAPQIIADYVGSPAACHTLRRVQSVLPLVSNQGKNTSAPSSPGYRRGGFGRCHSWSGGINKVLLPSSQSPSHRLNLSPLSSNPNYNASPSNFRTPPCPVPPRKRLSADHSASPSPSPPTHRCLHQDNVFRALSRSESAPVNIPPSSFIRNPKNLGADYSSQNKSSLPPHSPKVRKSDALPRAISANSTLMSAYFQTSQGSPPLSAKCVVSRPSEFQAALQAYSSLKVCKDRKDVSGSLSGMKISSSGSPCNTFSRSSSRRSYSYEIEDDEFSCPFAISDDEIIEFRSRTESLDGKGKVSEAVETSNQTVGTPGRSQDAAVGELVQILKSAPPLCRDFGNLSGFSQKTDVVSRVDSWTDTFQSQSIAKEHDMPGVSVAGFTSGMESSGISLCKTASDALKELKSYTEIKDCLRSQSGTQVVGRAVKSSQS